MTFSAWSLAEKVLVDLSSRPALTNAGGYAVLSDLPSCSIIRVVNEDAFLFLASLTLFFMSEMKLSWNRLCAGMCASLHVCRYVELFPTFKLDGLQITFKMAASAGLRNDMNCSVNVFVCIFNSLQLTFPIWTRNQRHTFQ